MKIPGLWSNSVKTYFYVDVEGYRQTGGVNRPTLSIPSLKERSGRLQRLARRERQPDPDLRPGHDQRAAGRHGRRAIPSRATSSRPNRISPLAQQWLQYLPKPTNDGPLNNYLVPTAIPDTILGDSNYFFGRFDTYIGQKDHIVVSLWHQRAPAKYYSHAAPRARQRDLLRPPELVGQPAQLGPHLRSNLLNHVTFGYLNRNEGYGCVNADAVDKLPQIAGVAGYNVPPRSASATASHSGAATPASTSATSPRGRPTSSTTSSPGSRAATRSRSAASTATSAATSTRTATRRAPSTSAAAATGHPRRQQRQPDRELPARRGRQRQHGRPHGVQQVPAADAWIFHAGDTWNATSKLTLNYGLRWDYYSPSSEKYDRLSFFDPNGANPAAGGRLGRLAFAGTDWGAASYGAPYPEKNWYGGFAPRLGVTYALNDKTLVRAGWGIFYDRAFYPGWGGGMNQDGFNSNVTFSSTLGGLEPAFYLQDGFPQDFTPAAVHPVRLPQRPGHLRTAPWTGTSGPARSSGT